MQSYRLTRRGKLLLVLLLILFTISVIKGSIYFSVFSFLFCTIALCLIVYEVYINK